MNLPDATKRDVDRAGECGITMEVGQIFVVGPRNAKVNVDDGDIAALKASKFEYYIHCSYLSNPWGSRGAFGSHLVRKERAIGAAIGVRGIVVHLAKKSPKEIAEVLPDLVVGDGPKIFLEIECHSDAYETPQKISALLLAIDEVWKNKSLGDPTKSIGICIDTAHLWAAGTNISSYASAKNYVDGMDLVLGDYSAMIHLNDQTWEIGSQRDMHAPLLFGTIWGKYNDNPDQSGLRAFVEWAGRRQIDIILERHLDKPKINNRPETDNLTSDWMILNTLT